MACYLQKFGDFFRLLPDKFQFYLDAPGFTARLSIVFVSFVTLSAALDVPMAKRRRGFFEVKTSPQTGIFAAQVLALAQERLTA